MLKHLETFFYPPVQTYFYRMPKDSVVAKITEILSTCTTLVDTRDMKGKFMTRDTFAISLVSYAYTRGVKYGSTLVGQIIESKNGAVEVRTKAKPSRVLYLIFFASIIISVSFFYKYIQTGLTEPIFWSLGILFLGPFLAVWISDVTMYSIRSRYDSYIHKALINQTTAANIGFAQSGFDGRNFSN